jgi:hypothetical protein
MGLVLINEGYKTRDCGLSNEGLCSPNIWYSLYYKMNILLDTKCPKKDCSIVNKLFRCFNIKKKKNCLDAL